MTTLTCVNLHHSDSFLRRNEVAVQRAQPGALHNISHPLPRLVNQVLMLLSEWQRKFRKTQRRAIFDSKEEGIRHTKKLLRQISYKPEKGEFPNF